MTDRVSNALQLCDEAARRGSLTLATKDRAWDNTQMLQSQAPPLSTRNPRCCPLEALLHDVSAAKLRHTTSVRLSPASAGGGAGGVSTRANPKFWAGEG